MDERGVSLQKCQCKYKCRHSSLGYQYVSRRTYYQHLCRERDGHLHPSVTKESFQQNHSDALPSVGAANYSNTLPSVEAANCSNTLPSVEVVVESTPSNQAQRRFWCNCRAYCYGGRFVAPSTYKRHQEANAKYQSLCSTFGLQSLDIPSSLNLENDLLLPSPTCCETSNDPCSLYEENDSVPLVDPVCEEHITADAIYEEHNLTEPVHVNERYIEETLNGDHEQDYNEDIQLNDKILQKIIEMQDLWDEHQVSIEFQDRMLKLLFDKKSNKNSESLSTLLVQLSSSWDGSLGGISVPTSWTQLNTLYRSLGMVDKERYLICMGSKNNTHSPILYEPIAEDSSVGNVVLCRCEGQKKKDNYIPGSFSVGEWKARIKYFFSAQCGAKLMLFFAADYYKQSILVEEESERLNVEPITGMSVLQQTPMPFTWDCIREVNSLLHKFIPWSFENSIIAYEIKDLSVRKRLLDMGSVGCVPPWVEEMDIVQIKEYDDRDCSTHTFAYAVVREVDVERRKVGLTRLLQMQSSAQLWKAGVKDLDWQDTSLCVAVVSGWEILKPKKITKDNNVTFWPCMDVRKWFKDYPFVSDLHHNLEEQGKIKALIEEKKGNLAKFEFQDAAYTWASDDIYQFVISYAQSQRKYDKKKCSKPVFLASNASQGEHDPKNGNLDLNVAMIEEESHSGSEHERTPTTMNLENLDSELENNLEHQSFVSLLTSGNLKRVRAIPQSPKMGMASQLVSKPTSAPLQVLQQDGESTRKSKRERKMSAKLRNSVTGKKPRLLSRKKKRQDIDNLNEDTTMRFVEHVNGENSSYLSNDTIHDRVSLLTVEEKETILLKYFDLQTIEDMCLSCSPPPWPLPDSFSTSLQGTSASFFSFLHQAVLDDVNEVEDNEVVLADGEGLITGR
ncbi:hypothetical protein L7F22_035456 [Adiantum nelumboides]|nr:hypothetical protein [Adiantum nelumboides]